MKNGCKSRIGFSYSFHVSKEWRLPSSARWQRKRAKWEESFITASPLVLIAEVDGVLTHPYTPVHTRTHPYTPVHTLVTETWRTYLPCLFLPPPRVMAPSEPKSGPSRKQTNASSFPWSWFWSWSWSWS